MYACQYCGNPVESTIEGELVCEQCWESGQYPVEMPKYDKDDNDRCLDCGRVSEVVKETNIGRKLICPTCGEWYDIF